MNQEILDELMKWLPLILPLLIIQLGVMIFVLVDIARKKRTKNLSPLAWVVIVIFLSNLCIGSILYLVVGRAEKIYDGKDDDI